MKIMNQFSAFRQLLTVVERSSSKVSVLNSLFTPSINYNYNHVQLQQRQYFQFQRGFRSSVSYFAKENENESLRGDKIVRVKLRSCRLDAVLKGGLSMSRNKVEKAVYDDRVRVNGQRPKKKSIELQQGDEVDVVRGYNSLNPDNFIDVNRVEVVEIGDEDDESDSGSESDSDAEGSKITVVLRRSKMLTIKNYSPPWKGSSAD